MTVQEQLFALRDEKYAAFSAKLIPTVEPESFIGVRSPQLRALAKSWNSGTLASKESIVGFLSDLPHRYHEENMLHAYLLCLMKDYPEALRQTEHFLPHVDNWAVCDSLSPRAFVRHKDELLPHIGHWLSAGHEYTVRFGIGMLMRHFLDVDFQTEHLQQVAAIHRDEYYIKMMQAWYFATALAKQWDATLPIVATLPDWVRMKSIQKACESFRVSNDHKTHLRTLR